MPARRWTEPGHFRDSVFAMKWNLLWPFATANDIGLTCFVSNDVSRASGAPVWRTFQVRWLRVKRYITTFAIRVVNGVEAQVFCANKSLDRFWPKLAGVCFLTNRSAFATHPRNTQQNKTSVRQMSKKCWLANSIRVISSSSRKR
jgi:hypothetical protein